MATADHKGPDHEIDQPLQELRTHLTGELVQPGDPSYDEARAVWNGMIDPHP
jgi:hypothetical protein